jgi:class 3 adenylate cyclase/pimeloyl-ACP methyl ester carboxylesterase
MDAPKTRYVQVGDSDVAYQIVGDGPFDLLYCYGLGSHIELLWGIPGVVEFLNNLTKFSRLIIFDRRGTGASDGVSVHEMPTLEGWTEDILAVMEGAGSSRATVLAAGDAGPTAILFAASHPEMVRSLILVNTSARYMVGDDYPIGASDEEAHAFVELMATEWGSADLLRVTSPSIAGDPEALRLRSMALRASATPRSAAAQFDYLLRSVDVRHALALIQAPTLVLHVTENHLVPIAHGQYIADHIAGSKFVELSGVDIGFTPSHLPDEVAEFLTGERPVVDVERILTTVLFTDIVGSTARAAALGDHLWRSTLDAHDKVVREQLRRFRGKEINTTGDGFVASFDGPARAIRCAEAIFDATGRLGVELRGGLHTGECEVRGDDLGGLTVHIAARVAALADASEVLVSGTVKDLAFGSGITFRERGEHELKGVPGSWKLFSAET